MPPEDPPRVVSTLVGESSRMTEIRELVRKLGPSRSPVLLIGETGTGKEVVARAIHAAGPAGPFVPIDCSLLGTLLETELFGHARGAFTGAVATKAGLLELAEGGTAFFDEIGEFPLELQVKLLRVLQEREIRPVGSLQRRKADFRPIAATNRDLAREVEAGRFRRDLYYRLHVVTVRVPPLRERREDIPALIGFFLKRYGGERNLSPELRRAMLEYDWPGNVRELENCIQRMMALNSSTELCTADLPSALAGDLARKQALPAAMAAAVAQGGVTVVPRRESPVFRLEEVEKRAILDALEYTRGDRARAAALLGIGRTTLYRRIKAYQL
jgi:DNA-binding NtrC family response regulator